MSEEAIKENIITPVYCNRCGRPSMAAELQVSDENMKEYLRCALGNRPFSKVIPVMGVIEFTFTMLPADLEVRLERHISKNEGQVNNLDIRMLLSLEKITKYDEDTAETVTVYEKSAEERSMILNKPEQGLQELSSKLDSALLNVARRASMSFSILCNLILEKMVSRDFYEGVGLL